MNNRPDLRAYLMAFAVPLLAASLLLAAGETAAQQVTVKEPDMRPAGEVYQNIELFQRSPRLTSTA